LTTKWSPSHRPGAQRRQVGPGLGLRHALAPDLVAAQHGAQEPVLLLLGAEAMIAGAMLATPMALTGPGAPARAISSLKTISSVGVASRPPCSAGHETAP
jgi:hypothetical protein